jgi:hydrogenase/urease accessory protein HupE
MASGLRNGHKMSRRIRTFLLMFLALTVWAPAALAHEVRPAFLQIREIDPNAYDILWKTPAQGNMRLALNVVLPETCSSQADPRTVLTDGAVFARWRETCSDGLVGKTIGIANLDQTLTDVIIRYEPLDGSAQTLRLTGDQPTAMIAGRQPISAVAFLYFKLGVEHILTGIDHLLFVFALLVLVGDLKRLLGAITAFTVAHSITLAGTTFGWLHLAVAPVEASIALSIAFVAAEIVHSRQGRPGLTSRWPWLASFGFGLLHGFGFAAALREIGIPDDAAPLALLFFNLGVEAGQIAFVSVILVLLLVWRRVGRTAPAWAAYAPAYIAGIPAAYWFIERTGRILFG